MDIWRLDLRLTCLFAGAAIALAAPAAARTPEQVADAALKAAPVWDGHNDVPEQLRDRRDNMISGFDFRDTTATADPAKGKGAMQTDLARLRKGRVVAKVGRKEEWPSWTPTAPISR